MKTVTLEVTQKDIDRAIEWKKKKNAPGMLSCNCPLARAGRRQFHNVAQAASGTLTIYKNNRTAPKGRSYKFDDVAQQVMNKFDSCQYHLLKPCTVTLTKAAG
jgi:hypothetical protein